MERNYTNRRYLDALNQRVLVYDGAMGTNIQKLNLAAEQFGGEKLNGCNDYLVLSYPQAIESIHRSFLEVGVDVIETDTFRANRITLGEYGLGERVIEINQAAAALARRLADEYSTHVGADGRPPTPRFVAGSIGPSGKLPSAEDPALSNIPFDGLADVFREQAVGLLRGGVDVLMVPVGDEPALAAALVTVLRDDRVRAGLRAAGARVARRFTWPAAAAEHASLYAELAAGTSRSGGAAGGPG